MADPQSQANTKMWARDELVRKYDSRNLRPPEVILLVRYRDALSKRVLDLGCGAGRLTGYLAQVAESVHGIDVNAAMLEACKRRFPAVTTEQRDLRDLSGFPDDSFEAVVGAFNVIDVLNDAERRAVLDEIHRVLTPDGLLVMSTHNRAAAGDITGVMSLRWGDPLRRAITLARLPRWKRNRRRLLPHEVETADYAILNDVSHDFAGMHYYVERATQERQFAEHGFETIEVLDREGRTMGPGDDSPESPELHYLVRPVTAP